MVRLSILFSLLLTLAAGSLVAAAPNSSTGDLEVVASGLISPRAFTWGADGTLYVAQAGTGGTTAATEEAPVSKIIGPFKGGPTASVVRIDAGCPVLVADGLPSVVSGTGEMLGAEAVAILGDHLYVSVDGGGPVHGNPDAPSGVYRVLEDGTTEVVADLSAWTRANPVATLPPDDDPDAAGFSMVADEAAGLLWVANPNSGEVLTVSPDGAVTRVADLSSPHLVPTGMVLDPEGGVYVGFLTPVPFPDGASKVIHVAADGTVEDVWTGLTAVTSVAIGADGTLYATEMSTGNTEKPPFMVPGSGRVVHQTGPDSAEPVAEGLMMPIASAFGPDGALYIALPGSGANQGEGMIGRIDLAATGSKATPAAAAAPAKCVPTGGGE